MLTLGIKKTPWNTPWYGKISDLAEDLLIEARQYGYKPPFNTKDEAAVAAAEIYNALESRVKSRVFGANEESEEDAKKDRDRKRRWRIGCPDVFVVIDWTPELEARDRALIERKHVVLPEDLAEENADAEARR